ncbi:MAG: vWA domain-containing protein [Myxococcota bacterium]
MASSREAAARSQRALPTLDHRLEVLTRADPAHSDVPWFEVRGRVGTAELFEADVVIALDMSISTNFPSGLDIDEDGVIGQTRGLVRALRHHDPGEDTSQPLPLPPASWTTDVDDTVAAMELVAARAIVTGLASRRNRVGIVSYANRAKNRSDVGPPGLAMAALDEIRPTRSRVETNIREALRKARDMLAEHALADGFPRERAVLLFTDGKPTGPVSPFIAELRAVEAATELAGDGIELYVFTFGSINVAQAEFILKLAGAGEGRVYRVGAPQRLLEDLPPVDLSPTWLSIENATTGDAARGVEARSDGHFGAFVPLAPGENRLRVLAELGDGRLKRWEGSVVYTPGDEALAQAETARVLREIEERAREADAAAGPPDEPTPR